VTVPFEDSTIDDTNSQPTTEKHDLLEFLVANGTVRIHQSKRFVTVPFAYSTIDDANSQPTTEKHDLLEFLVANGTVNKWYCLNLSVKLLCDSTPSGSGSQ
jgi:hypothetical protein